MSYELYNNDGPIAEVASNSGWKDAVDYLEGRFGAIVQEFLNTGVTTEPRKLGTALQEVLGGRNGTVPGPVRETLTNLSRLLLERSEQEVLSLSQEWNGKGLLLGAELTRDILPHEKKHSFDGHVRRQDATALAIRRILAGARPALIRDAARRAAQLNPAQLDTLILPFDRALQARIARSISLAFKYGYDQVYAERYRATGRSRKKSPTVKLAGRKSAREDKPGLIAEAAISDMNNAITAKARGASVDNYKKGLRGQELEDSILEDMLDSSDGYLDRMSIESARSGVAGGRFGALEDLEGEIARYVRSEAMDQNTCDPCSEGDGMEWTTLDDVDWSPGDDCEGKDACRGQLLPVFEDEGKVELE